MKIRQFGLEHLVRTVAMTAFVASIALAAPTGVGATAEDAYNNSITQIQVCEAMGGEAEVTTYMTGAGAFQTYVECHGGYMDGFDCINDEVETKCEFSRFEILPQRDIVVGVGDIKPLDEPVKTPVGGVVEAPETIAPPIDSSPAEDETVSEPTLEPTVEPVTDPVISDPVVSDGDNAVAEPTAEPTVDGGPIVDDGVIVDGTLEVAPEIDPSTSSGDETRQPFEIFEPIKGLPTK